MNFFKKILFLCLTLLAACSSSGGSDPLDIPAPVSHLSISSPNSDGYARVTGEAGAVDAQVTVTLTNTTTAAPTLVKFQLATVDLISNADGSFQGEIAAAIGDNITVTSTLSGAPFEETLIVPENVWALPTTATVSDLVYNPTTGEVIIVGNDGVDGYLHLLNPATGEVNTTTLTGLTGADKIDLDSASQIVVIRDGNDPANIYHHHLPTLTTVADATGGIAVNDLATSPDDNFALLANDTDSPSFSFYDLGLDNVTPLADIVDTNADPQIAATLVATDLNGANTIGAILSRTNLGFQVSTYQINPAIPSANLMTRLELNSMGGPSALVLFAEATEILVADATNNNIIRGNLESLETTTITTGNAPTSLAINAAGTCAFVILNTDRQLGELDLAGTDITLTQALGLNPTQIAVDPTGATDNLFILNVGDQTVSVFTPGC